MEKGKKLKKFLVGLVAMTLMLLIISVNNAQAAQTVAKVVTKDNKETEYASLKKDVTYEDVKAIYDKYYADEKFVRVLGEGVCPETKWVEGSNYVDIGFKLDPRTNRIVMMGAIDNLVKGAAGQAVQNMNLLFGLPESEGLELVPMFP